MAKEIIKENYVPATLFVGMGGIGSGIIKEVAEKCRGTENDNINFVVLDTNVNDLSSVKSSGKKIYCVQTSNTKNVGDYLKHDKDALENWFPKNAVLYDKTVSEGAGQVRAISRLALNSTIKLGNLKPLYEAIDELFRKTGKDMKQALRVVVAASATGGTGSGMTLPLTMFIRNYINEKYPNTAVIIRGMMLLPEVLDKEIKSEIEKDSLRRNAYATIKEINAFMMKGSGFFDIDGELKRYSDLHIDFTVPSTNELKSLDLLPFDFCFLFDGQNAEDNTLTSIDQYKTQAAQCLYEQNIGPMQKDAFSIEDNIIKEICNKGNYGRNRFGGLGAAVIRYPYEDIADYIAYQWAIDRIGGEGEAAKWSKYDKKAQVKRKEAKKKGIPESEIPSHGELYIGEIETASDPFSKDLQNMYINNARDIGIDNYFDELKSRMQAALDEDKAIENAKANAQKLRKPIDYSNDVNKGRAVEDLSKLRTYEMAIKSKANTIATRVAESIFLNENKTINIKDAFSIESVIKNGTETFHPNAMRYVLYALGMEMESSVDELERKVDTAKKHLKKYSSIEEEVIEANGYFDVKGTKKVEEKTLDDLCTAADSGNSKRTSEEIYNELNTHFPAYYKKIEELGNNIALYAAYLIGKDYINELSAQFMKFYNTFAEKTEGLIRKQEDLVAALKFRKGDSYYNVCADEKVLKEMASRSTNGEEGMMLPSDLCAEIFDAIKLNVRVDRENRSLDVVEEDKSVDIFDNILLGYFKKAVRENCDNIDLNIIDAIALEYRLATRVKAREDQGEDAGQIIDKVTHEDTERYIKETIGIGRRLSAPGIQRMDDQQPREINLCAYSKTLNDMRNFRIGDLLTDMRPTASETISKYEIHFFNALYNLTPDKLSKFACPLKSETGDREGGLYHHAYHEYAATIGPDSEKSMVISTHIDKRWDSVQVLPEIDFDYQKVMLTRIQKAFIYGLLYEAIQYREMSQASNHKMVYRLEDSDERLVAMTVSNGTLCDEFYEILDFFYNSAEGVNDVFKIVDAKRDKDATKNSNYSQTSFARAVAKFEIENENAHEGPTSLFEIPLLYHGSLPNTKRFDGEVAEIVDSVIDTFREQLTKWENEEDVPFMLCNILKEQFDLLVENFNKYESLRYNTKVTNNIVIDAAYRKVRALFREYEPNGYEEVIEEMKTVIKGK